jgi:hypothetical protein
MAVIVDKNINVSDQGFTHIRGSSSLRFVLSDDKESIILALSCDKTLVTTSLSKGDILILLEFLKSKELA